MRIHGNFGCTSSEKLYTEIHDKDRRRALLPSHTDFRRSNMRQFKIASFLGVRRYRLARVVGVVGVAVLATLIATLVPVAGAQENGPPDFDPSVCIPGPNDPPPDLFEGARPSYLVLETTDILSQPPYGTNATDPEPMVIQTLPAGTYVIVLDLDEQTRSYFRVMWPCGERTFIGWVDAAAIRASTRRINPRPAPPLCAKPLTTLSSLEETWVSNFDGFIAVVADLYRDGGGSEYPLSYFFLRRNGQGIDGTKREYTTSGPFLVIGADLSTNVRVGDEIGAAVHTLDSEPLHFYAVVYEVGPDCTVGPFGPCLNGTGFYALPDKHWLMDKGEVLGDVFSEPTQPYDNSTGTEPLLLDVAAQRQFRHSIMLNLNSGANLNRQNVEDCILTTYDLPDATDAKLCMIAADVPAGRVLQYVIEWTQVLREGNIVDGRMGEGTIVGTYSVVWDLYCQVVGVNVVR